LATAGYPVCYSWLLPHRQQDHAGQPEGALELPRVQHEGLLSNLRKIGCNLVILDRFLFRVDLFEQPAQIRDIPFAADEPRPTT
jgi:hypothetical protein